MEHPSVDDRIVDWVLATVGGNRLVSITGLRQGGAPWLFRFETPRGEEGAVLRVDPPAKADGHKREALGIALARQGGIPVADVIALSGDDQAALLLIQQIDGTSRQPLEADPDRLVMLGASAARISAVDAGRNLDSDWALGIAGWPAT